MSVTRGFRRSRFYCHVFTAPPNRASPALLLNNQRFWSLSRLAPLLQSHYDGFEKNGMRELRWLRIKRRITPRRSQSKLVLRAEQGFWKAISSAVLAACDSRPSFPRAI